MKPGTILLIGGSGQLGTALREVFSDVRVLAPTRTELGLSDSEQHFSGHFELSNNFGSLLLDTKPDVVINCAAFHNVAQCEMLPRMAFDVNTAAVGDLAKVCDEFSIPFIHVSTDYVFHGSRRVVSHDYDPYDTCRPINAYGVSKFAGERLALNANPKSTVIRTAGLYGPSGVSGKGPHFLERVLRAAESGQTFSAVHDVFFSPSYAPYVARNIRKIIEGEEYGEIHHVAGRGCVSWYEFANYARYVAFSGSPHTIGALKAIKLESLNEPFDRPMRVNLIGNTNDMPPWEYGVRQYINQRKGSP